MQIAKPATTRSSSTPALTRPARARAIDSLQWRLPLVFGALAVVMLATFIWAMSRVVQATLVNAGYDRAYAGALQVASMLEAPVRLRLEENGRLKADPTLRAALRSPTPQSLEAARLTLLASSTRAPRRAELWDSRGSLLLAVVSAASDSVTGLRAYPPGPPPTGPGIGEIQAIGKSNYYSAVLEIRADPAVGGALLGYLRRFGRLATSPAGAIRSLLGDSATVKIGSTRGGSWTDLDAIVDPPPALEGSPEGGEYRDKDGTRWVGAVDAIEGTPWTAWVGFPRPMIVAPAQPFMQRMIILALVLVVAGAALVLLLGARLTQPLRALTQAAEQIAAGDYSRRAAGHGRDEIGRLGDAFNTMTDRIERAYTDLRKSYEQTNFALAAARIGVWESDLSTGAVRCSASMHLLHRLPAGRLPETCDDFVNPLHQDDRENVRSILEGRSANEDEFDIQYRASGPGGSLHWMEGKGRVIRDPEGRPVSVLGLSIDVTDRTRLEAQFRQAQKMEAIGQLAGGIAHDFNNLLTAIIGHAGLILLELEGTSQLRSDVDEIVKAADSAAKMTHQLLAFSRGQVLQPHVIDVNAVIVDTRKLLARLIGERITLVSDLAVDIDRVKVDAGQLQQVLVNLAVNARDAMPQGGTLSITSSNVYLDDMYAAENPAVTPGPHVMIAVSDTGAGMDAATQARLFEPFFTTKGPGEGTGLGLATVYGIVKQSGGHIHVYSEVGRGTTFKVYLPVAKDGIAAVAPRIAPAPLAAVRQEGILVVDDNQAVRVVAKTVLERLGYRVLSAASGQEALEILKAAETRPSLLLSDVILPGMTGPELYGEVAALYPEIRVIFTSGYSPDAIAPHATLGPDFLFIEKPYNATKLASKIREALDHPA